MTRLGPLPAERAELDEHIEAQQAAIAELADEAGLPAELLRPPRVTRTYDCAVCGADTAHAFRLCDPCLDERVANAPALPASALELLKEMGLGRHLRPGSARTATGDRRRGSGRGAG